MSKRCLAPRACLSLLIALAAVAPVRAAVTAVSATPGTRNVTISRATSVPLVWSVTRTADATGLAGTTVVSLAGTFRAGSPTGPVLGTVTRSLTRTRPVALLTVFSFRETVLVPAAIVDQANRLGASRVFYVRTFDDGFGATAGTVELRITGGAGSAFGIERVELTFANGRVIDVVDAGEQVRAVARVSVSGSGLLRAAWEIAEPAGTAGEPTFRPLVTVRRWVAGRAPVALESPSLPVRLSGLHLVRLRITGPALAFAEPELRYVVRANEPGRPAPMRVLSPAAGAVLRPGMRFGWQAVARARVYRLEILDAEGDGGRIAGVVLGADRTRTALPEVTRRRLAPGRAYAWRIQAIDATGRVIGQSEPRTLLVSPPQPAEVTPAGDEAPGAARRRRQAPR